MIRDPHKVVAFGANQFSKPTVQVFSSSGELLQTIPVSQMPYVSWKNPIRRPAFRLELRLQRCDRDVQGLAQGEPPEIQSTIHQESADWILISPHFIR